MLASDGALAARLSALAGEDRQIFLIAQGSDGEGIALNYLLYPKRAEGASIGPKQYADDPFAMDITAAQWRRLLVEGGYDYVVLLRLNAHFLETCAQAFQDPSTIGEGCVYQVDPASGMLAYLP